MKSPTVLLVGMRGARTARMSTAVRSLMGVCSKELFDSAKELHDTCLGASLHSIPIDRESYFLMDDVHVRLGAAYVSGDCHEGRHVLASHAKRRITKISWCRILSRYYDMNFMESNDRWRRITIHGSDRLQLKISLCAFKVCTGSRVIPRWPHGRDLELQDAQRLEKVAKMLRRLEARSDPDCTLFCHHTSVKTAMSILREEFEPFHCKIYGCGIFTGLSPAVSGWPCTHCEGIVQVKVFGRGCTQVAALDDLAVVIVGLPTMRILVCGANRWFYPKSEGIYHSGHQLQRLAFNNKLQSHKKGVAQLAPWVSLIWCLTGVRFHTITIAEHVACDKPDFVDWLRNHLHEKFRLSYYTTRLMVDFPRCEKECLTSGTWAELQRPSQIYVHQAVPHDFQEYRDLLHSSETSKLESALRAGQDPNCLNERGQTAAWRASRNGDLQKLRCLHKANADFDKTAP